MQDQLKTTIGATLDETARAHPHRLAAADSAHRYTYEALKAASERAAKSLLALGLRRGDPVGVWAKDATVMLICLYGIWKIGAVAVPLCTSYARAELEYCVKAADVKLMLTGSGRDALSFADTGAALPPHVLQASILNDADFAAFLALGNGTTDEALYTAAQAVEPCDTDTLLFTSGTTGATKPVMTSHYARVNVMRAQAQVFNATKKDVYCAALPMYHCFSLTACVLAAMCVGAALIYPADRHSDTILKTIQREGCTILSAVPTLFSALLRCAENGRYDVPSLRIGMIGGAVYSPAFFCRIERELNMTLLPSLGQTEATAGFTAGAPADSLALRSQTLGKFFPGLEGCIKKPGGTLPLCAGEEGEICVRGYCVMKGYYRLPEETRAVVDGEGWLHTGDLGRMDGEGYLYFTGRLKNLIIRGGENIAPAEIENILTETPGIEQAAVLGVPDAHYSEEICACIVRNAGITEEAVKSAVRQRAAYYKTPRYVLFFDKFPRSAIGKTDRKALQRIAEERITETSNK